MQRIKLIWTGISAVFVPFLALYASETRASANRADGVVPSDRAALNAAFRQALSEPAATTSDPLPTSADDPSTVGRFVLARQYEWIKRTNSPKGAPPKPMIRTPPRPRKVK
jgi:hypothetical protein